MKDGTASRRCSVRERGFLPHLFISSSKRATLVGDHWLESSSRDSVVPMRWPAGDAGIWASLIACALVVMVTVHELGHVIAARILGDRSATFLLYDGSADGRCIGCTIIDVEALSDADLLVVSAAGVLATQSVALLAVVIWGRVGPSRPTIRRALATLVVSCALDGPYQAIQGFRTSIPPSRFPTGIDAVDLAHLVEDRTGIGSAVATWVLLVVSLAWLGVLATLGRRRVAPDDLARG